MASDSAEYFGINLFQPDIAYGQPNQGTAQSGTRPFTPTNTAGRQLGGQVGFVSSEQGTRFFVNMPRLAD